MAKLVYGLNQSLDGYVDHLEFRFHQLLHSFKPIPVLC
jgi:hypothetical protein